MNNSSTGGYVRPISTQPLPRQLNFNQFIQTVLVGVSGLDGPLVRPKWQIAPPKQPDLATNWLAFGAAISKPDAGAFIGVNAEGANITQRHEQIDIPCSFYGPDAAEIAAIVRDGFQIPQNLEGLRSANMGFVETTLALHIPDLVNERFINRVEMTVVLRREVQRIYPILTILSATGRVHTVLGDEEYLFDWQTENEEI